MAQAVVFQTVYPTYARHSRFPRFVNGLNRKAAQREATRLAEACLM